MLRRAPFSLINRALPLIRHILNQETDPDILGRVITLAGEKQINGLTDDLTEYLFYGDPTLKSLAIQSLVQMDSPEALGRLEQVAATEKCDGEILNAIDFLAARIPAISRQAAMHHEKREFSQTDETFLNHLVSKNPHEQFEAFQYFANSRDKVFQAVSRMDETCNPALLMILLRIVAITRPPEAVKLLLHIITREKPQASLRFMVYNALQAYPDILGTSVLISSISDPVAHVRISAAKMLNKHCTSFVIAAIKSKIESGTATGANLAISILDARAVNLTEKLIPSDSFFYTAFQHMEQNASLPVIDSFIEALEKRNMRSSIKRCRSLRQQRAEKHLPRIMMVNPSRACLDAFSAKMSPAGYETLLFSSPQEAFERLMEEKPGILITGIFLGDMHCIDFIKEVRTLYPEEELPVIVSSIMHVDIDNWEKHTGHTGITAWCSFPPSVSQITSWFSGKK